MATENITQGIWDKKQQKYEETNEICNVQLNVNNHVWRIICLFSFDI